MFIEIDVRENKLINLLENKVFEKNISLEKKQLVLADIILKHNNQTIMIERKSINDLAASISDGRYSEQSFRLDKCQIHNHNIIYLIEGDIRNFKNTTRINQKALYSSLLSLNIFKGFSVMRTFDLEETANLIIHFCEKMIKNSSNISENKIQKVIKENFDEIAPFYYKLLSEWTNSSYETFQDIDKYLIILYLINKDFDYYIKNEIVESYDTFFLYDKSLELDRINIIEISKNLIIPKESARRKILRLEEFGVLKKIGKKIYIDRSAFRLVQPKNTLQNLCALLSKIAEICEKNNLINQSKQFDEISNEIKNNFTYCW